MSFMWTIRILTGPQAGQTFSLKNGRHVIGRSPQCHIQLNSSGISKEHCELHVQDEKVMVMDLRSSNGTYLNGVRVQNGSIKMGDKIGLHDVIFDIVKMSSNFSYAPAHPPAEMAANSAMGAASIAMPQDYSESVPRSILEKISDYMEKVVLPGFYKMAEIFELKMVMVTFVFIFIFMTTLLSLIPMIKISKTSILTESKRRSQSIVRNLAILNQSSITGGVLTSLSTHGAEAEEGVKQVMIVQQSDGMILAPSTRAGTTPDLPFVHKARREMRAQTEEIDSSTIGASFPIGLFDPSTGEQSVKAHAIVIYDVGSLSFDDGQVISLFIQTLVLATLLGLIIFYFMYKLIEHPIVLLNSQLDTALREKKDSTEIYFRFPALQILVGNINSLLTRYLHGDGSHSQSQGSLYVNKDVEAINLSQMIPYPVLMLAHDGRVITANLSFEQLTHITTATITNQNVEKLPDAALQQNISHLISAAKLNTQSIHVDSIEFGGQTFKLSCQAMLSDSHQIAYFVIIISPYEGGST